MECLSAPDPNKEKKTIKGRAKRVDAHVVFTADMSNEDCVSSKLSFVGQDVRKLPLVLTTMYGQRALALDLSFNQMVTLDGLERFTKLEELILDNNRLSDGIVIPQLPFLHTLSLNKNCISDLDDILSQVSRKTPEVRYISLLGNPACPDQLTNRDCDQDDYQRYRYYVVYCLPKLRFLDSTEVDPKERVEAQRRGRFMRVMRPTIPGDDDSMSSSPGCGYSPLPLSSRALGDHQVVNQRLCRYRYMMNVTTCGFGCDSTFICFVGSVAEASIQENLTKKFTDFGNMKGDIETCLLSDKQSFN